MGRLLNWLVEDHWRVETPEEELWGIDAIVPLSYTTTKEKLTAATEAALRKAADYKKKMRQAVLAFGNCPYPFRAAEKIEAHFKGEILYRERLKSSDYLDTGDLNNSIEEAENARDTLKVNGITPKRVLIVTGEMHSRRAHYIWQNVFPSASIMVRTVAHIHEYHSNYPVATQRNGWIWFFFNVATWMALHTGWGWNFFKNHHHPTAAS